jgi:hypothetical protein
MGILPQVAAEESVIKIYTWMAEIGRPAKNGQKAHVWMSSGRIPDIHRVSEAGT